jgi:hypothetical protein
MALIFEQREFILKWYWKFENICEVQRQWSREFAADPATRLRISRIRDKYETGGTVRVVCVHRSGSPRLSTEQDNFAVVLQQFT